MRDLKYILAYLLPISAFFGIYWGDYHAWGTPIVVFGIVPIVEQVFSKSTTNVSADEEASRSNTFFFDLLLYLNLPILYGIVLYYCYTISTIDLTWMEIAGMTISTGLIVGANGINVAHELGHRSNKWEQWLSKALLLPALYQHFFIEHNLGHHKHVATDQDPASARRGQLLYVFWWQSVSGGYLSAWRIEVARLQKEGLAVFSLHNSMLRMFIWQTLWLAFIALIWGFPGFVGAVAVGVIGFLLLETINYVEHYGLRRQILASGRPEPVSPAHSWNSNHEVGRILLYELTRHSDHHYKSTRKYQVLRHLDESPQLPYGYPASLLLALFPPLWFRIMDPLLKNS